MGLNYVKRPPREEFDSPNDFITVSLGETDLDYANHDEELILLFQKNVLDRVEQKYKEIDFIDRY